MDPKLSLIQIVNAPESYDHNPARKSVFLAGTIVEDDVWRRQIITQLSHLPITILNPYQPKWDSTWDQDISDPKFNQQVTWELDMMEAADVIAVYFGPVTEAPITMLEIGLGARSGKVVVACPKSKFSRRGNLQILAKRLGGIVLLDSLEELGKGIQEKLNI